MADALLELSNVETAYGRSQVLFGVSFAITAGQMVTLMGRNGMGKTTTVRSIMGLTPARAGSIRFKGEEIAALAPYRIAQRGVGLVPEGRRIFPNLTVRGESGRDCCCQAGRLDAGQGTRAVSAPR